MASAYVFDFGVSHKRRYKPCRSVLVEGTLHSDSRPVEHVRVNHRRGHIFVAKQLLNCANIVAAFEQMRRKRMSERVTRCWLCDTGTANCIFHCALKNALGDVVTLLFS